MFDVKKTAPQAPLYHPEFEHDNCGIGACVNIKGRKSRETVENAPTIKYLALDKIEITNILQISGG